MILHHPPFPERRELGRREEILIKPQAITTRRLNSRYKIIQAKTVMFFSDILIPNARKK